MFGRKFAVAAAFVGSMIVAGVASAETRVVYTGGHDTTRLVRVETVNSQAPYALTGNQDQASTKTPRMEPIHVGSRIVGYRVVNN